MGSLFSLLIKWDIMVHTEFGINWESGKQHIRGTAKQAGVIFVRSLLIFLILKVDEPGSYPLDRVELHRGGRL